MLEGIFCIITLCLLFYIKDLKSKAAFEIRKLKEKTWSLEVEVENERMNKADSENHAKISREFLEDERRHSKIIEQELSETQEKLQQETEQRKKVLSQKKSGEVRLGHIAETLAPFLDQFDFDPENCCFMGKPIDYVSFGDDEITFIEVKSGNAQLSTKQRHIRDLVKQKLVSWKEVRIK
mgnify:CR=1 FL=1|tara:strand:+ start:4616 stop:5155 length:540 start_codon:yes stop_codon:yes gene_type:complete